MAFRFSLATVLRFRESVEKREELALQKILLEMARVRREIERITAEIAAAHEARNQAMQNPLPASHLHGMLNDVEAAADRRKNLLQTLATLAQQHQLQAAKYQAAHRDRQMLSDMKTKKRDVYEHERARATQKFLDDIFAARSHRS
jgi:flagellar export protein FliJ